jgi:hypothetical protein
MANEPVNRDADREVIEGAAGFSAKASELIGGALVSVAVLSLGLKRDLYARETVTDALKKFALAERTRVRILVADARAATASGNPFLDLARRLPSRIQMRELTPEKREADGPEIIIADGRRMLELPEQGRFEAYYYGHAAKRVLEKLKDYETLWDESEPVVELSGMRL